MVSATALRPLGGPLSAVAPADAHVAAAPTAAGSADAVAAAATDLGSADTGASSLAAAPAVGIPAAERHVATTTGHPADAQPSAEGSGHALADVAAAEPAANDAAPAAPFAEGLAPTALLAARDSYEAAIDPLVRGTRPINGTTATGVALGEGQYGAAGLHLTPFGLQVQGDAGHGHEASVTLDRHSALGSARLPLGSGGDVTLTAGAIANLAYANVTVHEANGLGLGVLGVMTHGGSPGLGASLTYAGAHVGVAVAPTVLFDKAANARVQGLASAQPTAPGTNAPQMVAIEQTHAKVLAGNAPLSIGHAGFAASVRVSADLREQRSYSFTHPLNSADERAPHHRGPRQRLEALGAFKRLPKLPTLTEVVEAEPGTKLTVAVESSASVGVGLSLAGAQLIGAAVRSRKTEASVEVPAAQATASTTKVVRIDTRSEGKFVALDVPGLLSANIGRQAVTSSSITHHLERGAATSDAALFARGAATLGFVGHFAGTGVNAENMADVVQASATFDQLHSSDPTVNQITLSAVTGGRSLHVGALQLAASLAGPRLGLSLGYDHGRQVHYASASRELTMVAKGHQQRRQRELPMVGGLTQQLEMLRLVTKRRDVVAPNAQLDVVRFSQRQTHASGAALAKVQQLLQMVTAAEPEAVATPTAPPRPPMAMDLDLQLQVVVKPETVYALAGPQGLLAGLDVPPSHADLHTRQLFVRNGLAQLHATVRSTAPNRAQSMLAALARADAEVSYRLDSNLFRKLQKKAAKVVVKVTKLKRKSNATSTPRQLRKVAAEAVAVADDLQNAMALVRGPMFVGNDPKLHAAQKDAVRTSLDGIAIAFHPREPEERNKFPLEFSPRTGGYFDQLRPSNIVPAVSPPLETASALPPTSPAIDVVALPPVSPALSVVALPTAVSA